MTGWRLPPNPVFTQLQNQYPNQLKITPDLSTEYMAFNVRKKKLSDPKVRRAISYGFDRDIISKDVLGPAFSPLYTFAPTKTMPDSSKLDKDDSRTLGISGLISSAPNFVSLEMQVNSSMCIVVNLSSFNTFSDIIIESSKL